MSIGYISALLTSIALTTAAPAATSPAAGPPPDTPVAFQAMTLKLDHDEGAEHMCPASGQLTSFQANAILDNAPIVVELLGPDHKPLAGKAWSTAAGLRVLPLVQGALRITMICAVK